jgi:hypothetical protein
MCPAAPGGVFLGRASGQKEEEEEPPSLRHKTIASSQCTRGKEKEERGELYKARVGPCEMSGVTAKIRVRVIHHKQYPL